MYMLPKKHVYFRTKKDNILLLLTQLPNIHHSTEHMSALALACIVVTHFRTATNIFELHLRDGEREKILVFDRQH